MKLKVKTSLQVGLKSKNLRYVLDLLRVLIPLMLASIPGQHSSTRVNCWREQPVLIYSPAIAREVVQLCHRAYDME
jgi:hypothetical protein